MQQFYIVITRVSTIDLSHHIDTLFVVDMYDKFLAEPQHRDKAKVTHLLGRIYVARQDDKKALFLFQQAMQIWKATLRPQHPDLLICTKDLARLHWRRLQRSLEKIKQNKF